MIDENQLKTLIQMDFFRDAAQQARERLMDAGYFIDASETPEQICIKYFNVAKRRISVQVRKVLLSKEFRCPPELEAGFYEVGRKAEAGEDLRPHQSTRLADADYDDALLNDWGVHHLHLGTSLGPDGFVARSGPLLFARVIADTLYCVNVLTHGAFSQQEMVAIIQRNWPDTGVVPIGIVPEPVTDENIRALRKAGVNVIPAMRDGSGYFPMGGGYVTSGKSIEVIRSCHYVKSVCNSMEGTVRNVALAHLAQERKKGKMIKPHYEFQLRTQNSGTVAAEIQTGLSINLGQGGFKPL